ncbi:stress response protein CsbD [Sporosarcina sp. NCCP-2222]|uniref:CsbD family protein n=1 Tax=Sporosarcina sp. NCCP-2222 TaxID=2935073 RepID=UPI002080C380|nr:CsbD family protein [Sporosarcina sp. NCCP-2222]GKV56290.1 stress response protein CsbD [Sporosarcina sp. NCCP-2222]
MKDNGFSDKMKGAVSKAKGEVKDQVGNASDDPMLQAEGKLDKMKGEVQKQVGNMKDRANNDDKW